MGSPSACYDPFKRHLRPVPIIPWGGKVISEHPERDTQRPGRRYRNERKEIRDERGEIRDKR
jgi:hypothetical protein